MIEQSVLVCFVRKTQQVVIAMLSSPECASLVQKDVLLIRGSHFAITTSPSSINYEGIVTVRSEQALLLIHYLQSFHGGKTHARISGS